MSVAEKSSICSTLQWVQDVQPYFRTFSQMIEKAPMLQFDKAREIAQDIWELREAFQRADCPAEMVEIYNQFVHATLNLFMCYTAVASEQWEYVAEPFECAVMDWDYTKKALRIRGFYDMD